jgi:hypothetical protein
MADIIADDVLAFSSPSALFGTLTLSSSTNVIPLLFQGGLTMVTPSIPGAVLQLWAEFELREIRRCVADQIVDGRAPIARTTYIHTHIHTYMALH